MAAPPAYAADPAFPISPATPWIGHMDAATAGTRAFSHGLRDGQRLLYGDHKPALGGAFTELHYLRGLALGMTNSDHGAPPGFYTQEVIRRELSTLAPSPWIPPAILSFPSQPPAALPRHERPILHRFAAIPLPYIPLPENVDRDSLTTAWSQEQTERLFQYDEPGCWIAPECYRSFPVSTAATSRAVESTCLVWGRAGTPVTCIQPDSMRARCMGPIFVTGPEDTIGAFISAKFICTPWMNMITFPNRSRRTTFVCTFESESCSREDHEDILLGIREALDDSAEAKDHCVACGKDPIKIFSSIELEYASPGNRHLWNVSTTMPGSERHEINRWCRIIRKLRPKDGRDKEMTAVHLECEVCGCWRHSSCICPTRAYRVWRGAVRNEQ